MKRIAPILILLLAAGITTVLILLRPEPSEVAPERPTTKVEVITVQPQSLSLTVESQGTVLPRIETDLAVEVSGRIIAMSTDFRAGGRFAEGDVLFRIDPSDYEAAVATSAAELAQAELSLAQELALAEQAAADWEALGEGQASDLTLRKPQVNRAKALIVSAEAALKRARRDLERTEIRAPYDGLVLSKSVDLGQYVMANPANPVARIYATGAAEVRLPLAQREAEFLIDPTEAESKVTLRADTIVEEKEWDAQLVRFEATIDPGSRLVYAVAEVDQPFEIGLRRGMFVQATIVGRQLDYVYVLPRYALRGSDSIYVVTESDELVTRKVDVVKTDAKQAVIAKGLAPGDQVATSPIAYFVENMPVEVIAN